MKLIDWPKYSWCSAKESSVLSKRIVGSQQKNRRCSAKESSVLFKRIDDAKRKQSIYSLISLNCYASGGSNTGQKHSKIIVFPLGFREAFSLLHLSMDSSRATQWSYRFGKDTCVFPMSLSTLMRTPVIIRVILSKGGALTCTPIAAMY